MNAERTRFFPWLIDYTMFFFSPDGAPVLQWWKYFASTRRMWIAIRETEKIRDGCSDVYEWGNVRNELLSEMKSKIP